MQKLTLTCECGQEMLVPEDALGRVGYCPACGREIEIEPGRTRVRPGANDSGRLLSMHRTTRRVPAPATAGHAEDAGWRRFAEAVDLYNGKRFAESLALLNALHAEHPDNPQVNAARAQCLRALQRSANALTEYEGARVADDRLTPALVKSVVLDKMLHAKDESVQLQAAELAARLLDLFPRAAAAASAPEPDRPTPPDIVLGPEAPTPEHAGAESPALADRVAEEYAPPPEIIPPRGRRPKRARKPGRKSRHAAAPGEG